MIKNQDVVCNKELLKARHEVGIGIFEYLTWTVENIKFFLDFRLYST